jgi:putative phosphoserine phosphatase/1-acylglycerol-3-phosphate O-acyltransferase
MNHRERDYPAFFDVDRTVLEVNSGSEMVRASLREGLIGIHQLLEALLLTLLYRFRLLSAEKTINRLVSWFRGREEKMLRDFAERLFHSRLRGAIREGARREMVRHRENNAEIVLLSAATSLTCRPLQRELPVDSMICSEVEVQSGLYTGRALTPYCYGTEKVARAEAFCRERGYDLSRAWYYADSASDIPFLEKVGHPVCVHPDNTLRQEAHRRGWEVVQWE